ncbi:MAG TPA: thymidine phosphorylase [Candidatus Deferrimicrobium sp.]|nr:thymidine phosphorylase [Candidatus Deferrimicrobium sp.]
MNNNTCSPLNAYEIIAKKRDGSELTTAEIQFFIDGVVKNQIPDYQAAALLMAIYIRGLNQRESADLTRIMMLSGDQISLEDIGGIKIDKHSTGGVGDKISFIVAPLVAACGVKVPMLSGRSLGHTGGTLDKLEAIPGMNISLEAGEFKRVLQEVGMVICGQTANIVPADRKLYSLRDTTATVNSIPLICASIMSKKLALGTNGMVLDVKTGCGAFMCRLEDSIELCKTMVATGENSGRTTIGLITDMNQPLGNNVGNSLEIIESIEALKGKGPGDLMAVTYALGAAMLVAAGVEKEYLPALQRLEKTLRTGEPLHIFRKFIAAQGGNADICDDYTLLPQGKNQVVLTAEKAGYITGINAYEVGMAAIDIGAGRRKKEDTIDYGSGFVFHKKTGDEIKKGDAILTIHSSNIQCLPAAEERLRKAIIIRPQKPSKPKMIHYLVDKNGIREWID